MSSNSRPYSARSYFLQILSWSVLSAAFIGPGTVTTAAKSGSQFGNSLLWALLFSAILCLILQEAVMRIRFYTDLNLGQALRQTLPKGFKKSLLLIFIGSAILSGTLAYEAGNLLGARAGIELISSISPVIILLVLGFFAALILNLPSRQSLLQILGGLVGLMGLAFVYVAFRLGKNWGEILFNSLVPSFPDESSWLILGLIGTTVVPYNLFLGSGISTEGQALKPIRVGLAVAILLGGLISMMIMVVGTQVQGEFSFPALAQTLEKELGAGAKYLFSFGLWGAGFTSTVTAALASAITAQSLFSKGKDDLQWQNQGLYFKGVWLGILSLGLSLGLLGWKPIPVIILAQVLNGLILPLMTFLIIELVNHPQLIPKEGRNSWVMNLIFAFILALSIVLGSNSLFQLARSMELWNISVSEQFYLSALLVIASLGFLGYRIYSLKRISSQ